MFNNTYKLSILAVTLSSLLAACGGGDGSNSGNGSASSFTPKTISGNAIDFYLAGATIQLNDCVDSNNAPVFTTTDNEGNFEVNTTKNCQESSLTITGGTDIVTGLPFTGTLKLKKTNLQDLDDNLSVSLLTTLQSYLGTRANTEIKPILVNLGLSATTLAKLESTGYDLSHFDPSVEATARDMAIIFVVQQLANQIEDSMQTLSKNNQNLLTQQQAADITFVALLDQLTTTPLFTASNTNIDSTVLQHILDTAADEARLQINDNTVVIDSSLTSPIHNNVSTITTALNSVTSDPNASAASLQTAIQNSPSVLGTIQASVQAPSYSGFSLAGKSIAELLNSSSTSPLNINLSGINNALTVNFKLNNTKSQQLNDSVKMAFQLTVQRDALQQTLNVAINNIALNYNSDGSIASAVIPAGAKISITSTVSSVSQATITLQNSVTIAANGGVISLQNLIDSNAVIKNNYNTYISRLRVNDAIQVTAFVLPTKYVVDSSLGLGTTTMAFDGESFVGSTLTAHFKIN